MSTTTSSSLDYEVYMADVVDACQQCVELKSDLRGEKDRRKEVFDQLNLNEVLQLKKQIKSDRAMSS